MRATLAFNKLNSMTEFLNKVLKLVWCGIVLILNLEQFSLLLGFFIITLVFKKSPEPNSQALGKSRYFCQINPNKKF